MLAACGSAPVKFPTKEPLAVKPLPPVNATTDSSGNIIQPKSRMVPVAWVELPGFEQDNLADAWKAWLKSCERSVAPFVALCADVKRLSNADGQTQRDWMRANMQPHRVETMQGDSKGLLTSYFEPQIEASRLPTTVFKSPLYQPPVNLAQRKPWYTRHEIDTLPEAQAALKDRVIAYVADPVDALILQIQGSGRLRIAEPNGSVRAVRLANAGTNEQPYHSVGRWLLDQGLVKDASWPGIKAWLAQNPQRQQELLWTNPRYVFFKEELLADADAQFGPKGAQGVALTAGRSIAVDPGSIPYGAPVWLVSSGAQTNLQRLVLAQDTGNAIRGAVRADYFAGWGPEATDLAGRLNQPLQLWVLWPK
jgi:membrane-bound lytic murein transglycosylase A